MAVLTMEEAAFLLTVQRIIHRFEVNDDLLERSRVAVEKDPDEEPLNRVPIGGNPMMKSFGDYGRWYSFRQSGSMA